MGSGRGVAVAGELPKENCRGGVARCGWRSRIGVVGVAQGEWRSGSKGVAFAESESKIEGTCKICQWVLRLKLAGGLPGCG